MLEWLPGLLGNGCRSGRQSFPEQEILEQLGDEHSARTQRRESVHGFNQRKPTRSELIDRWGACMEETLVPCGHSESTRPFMSVCNRSSIYASISLLRVDVLSPWLQLRVGCYRLCIRVEIEQKKTVRLNTFEGVSRTI